MVPIGCPTMRRKISVEADLALGIVCFFIVCSIILVLASALGLIGT
jgi:hypothetical protein